MGMKDFVIKSVVALNVCRVPHGLKADHPTSTRASDAFAFAPAKLVVATDLATANNATRGMAAFIKPVVVLKIFVGPATTNVPANVTTRPRQHGCRSHHG